MRTVLRTVAATAATAVVALVLAAVASAHARVSPAVSLSGKLQLYSLAIPTEKANVTTTKIVMSVPEGFGIDSFVPAPGWKQVVQSTGAGDNAVVQKVTWTGGSVPTGDDSLFQFLAQPAKSGTYRFLIEQTYSDGSIVDWSGPESAAAPAPAIEAVSSLGGGSSSTLALVAVALGALALIVAASALLGRGSGSGGKRDLA
ncbi:MAG TPA: DUF1775 domain-containing protein [Gaiellaceae bacterium]